MSSLSLGRHELREIRELLHTEVQPPRELQRRKLKDLSTARVAQWPNTLAAIRHKKEEARSDREAKEEAERRVVDREEAERRAADRKEKIDRANGIIYSQTDKMKVLRGKLMLVDVLKDRERQIAERRRKQDIDQQQDGLWHDELLRQLANQDAKEKVAANARSKTAMKVAGVQQDQLEAYRDTYIAQLMEEKEEGVLVQQKSDVDAQREKELDAGRRRRARQNNIDVKKANEELKKIKAVQDGVERTEERKIEEFSKEKEKMARLRKRKEKEKNDEHQRKRQEMIDRAVRELAALQKDEGARLQNQADEVRDKQDREDSSKAQRRQRQQNAIDRSRQMQMDMKQRSRATKLEKDKIEAAEARKWNSKLEDEEVEGHRALRRRDVAHQDFLFAQMQGKAVTRARESTTEMGEAERALGLYKDEEVKFHAQVRREIANTRAEGKDPYPIVKCLTLKEELMAA